MTDTFNTTESDWQGVDATPQKDSHNLLESGCIQSILDVEPPTTVLKNIDLSNYRVVNGYINKSTNKIVTASGDNKIVFFPLKSGETLYYDVYSPASNVGFLGNWVDDNNCQCLVVGTNQRENSSYTAAADMTLAVGVNKTQSPLFKKYVTEYGESKVIDAIEEDVLYATSAAEILGIDKTEYTRYTDIPYTKIEGYAIKYNGLIVNADYNSTDWIFLKAGTEIKIKARSSTSYFTLAKKDRYVFTETVFPVITNLATIDQTVVLDEDTYYAACWNKNYEFVFQIKESAIGESSEFVDKINNELYSFTTDDFSTGRVDGKYMRPDGEQTNQNFPNAAYKIFENVQAATKITCTSSANPAIPIILFKGIGKANYEAVASVELGGIKTVEYTTVADGSIAINASNITRGISVKFDLNKMESDRTNISYLLNKDVADDKDYLIQSFQVGHMFDKIAAIGDSMSSGSINGTGHWNCTWLSFLAKRWNCSLRRHYTKGGCATYWWLINESNIGLGNMLADNRIYDAYFIAMGHNDQGMITGQNHILSVGSATDTPAAVTIDDTDPTNIVTSVPDGLSFCSYYKAIIEQIRVMAPKAMIFCLPEYDSLMAYSNPAIRQAVIDIAEYYRDNGDSLIFHLETGGVPDAELVFTGHYSAQGYQYIAKRIDEEVNRVLYENRGDPDLHLYGGYYLPNEASDR